MTILNAWVSPGRAVIGVDTKVAALAASDSRPLTSLSKLVPLVHANVVIAGRGHSNLLTFVLATIHGGPASTFDAIDAEMPGLLGHGIGVLQGNARLQGLTTFDAGLQQLLIAGWSARFEEMTVAIHERRPDGTIWRDQVGGDGEGGDWLSAWEANKQGEAPVPCSVAAMEAVARAQVKFAAKHHPGAITGTGGRLITAELTRSTCVIRQGADLS